MTHRKGDRYVQLLVLARTAVESKLVAEEGLPRGRSFPLCEAVLLHDEAIARARTAQQLGLTREPVDMVAVRVLRGKLGGFQQLDCHELFIPHRPCLKHGAHASAARLFFVAGYEVGPLDLRTDVAG